MSIEKYTTEAFILREYPQGENDFVYKVWTKDFGIIFVLARSIRKINAKLRMNAKKNEFLNMTLVKGKDIWRLTGVEELKENLESSQYFSETKLLISETINRFLEEKKTYKKLFEKLKFLTISSNDLMFIDPLKLRILIYYLVLVDTGYADAKVIGVKDIEEYKNFEMKDFYIHFFLNEKEIKDHIIFVLKHSML